ncbi:hypothetical protein, partial [uncultured Helicobacter sp.]|uniref:hypothetical protein n=1 Tax=uncultured Helicobacter sp. TaxID=175537 RepID=UPI002611848B
MTNLHAGWGLYPGDDTYANCNPQWTGSDFQIDPKNGDTCKGDSVSLITDGGWNRTLILKGVTLDSFGIATKNATINAFGIWGKGYFNNSHIGTANIEGRLKVELAAQSGTNTMNTLNHTGSLLNIKTLADDSTLAITTLNQATTGLSQIFKNVSVEHFNLYA